jgi:two-component sensor histidine kinase
LSVGNLINAQKTNEDSLLYYKINEQTKKNIKEGKFYDNINLFKAELQNPQYSNIFKSKIYNDIAANYGMASQLDSALLYTDIAIQINEKLKIKNQDYYNSLTNKANIYYSKGNLVEALKLFQTTADFYKKSNYNKYIHVLITIGDICIKTRSFDDAMSYLNTAESHAMKHQNYELLYRTNHYKAQLQYYKKKRMVDNSCLDYASNALTWAKKTDKAFLVADAKSNLGTYLWKSSHFQEAIVLLTSADSFYTSRNISKQTLNLSLAKAYYSISNYELSKHYFEKINSKTLPELDKIENDFLQESLKNKSNYYNLFIKYKSALDSINIDEVDKELIALDKKYKLLEKDNQIRTLNENLLNNQVKAQNLEVENLRQIAENERIIASNIKIDLELKENQIKQFESEQKILNLEDIQTIKQRTIITQRNYLLGGGIGLLCILALSFYLYRQKEKLEQLNEKISTQKNQIQLLNSELNHRVKNNLSFMTSLLEMQGRRSHNLEIKEALKESENRLKALALVHSQLFKSESDTEVNLKKYLQEVTIYLKEIFATKDKPIEFETNYADFQINAEDAMRLGLIVNELVTNSVKHAFNDVENPLIKISTNINTAGKLSLHYADNGPKTIADLENNLPTESLGLKLISLLKKQLGDQYILMM